MVAVVAVVAVAGLALLTPGLRPATGTTGTTASGSVGGTSPTPAPAASARLSGTSMTSATAAASGVASTTWLPAGPATRPATDGDPSRPGTVVDSGQDESDPFLLLVRGRYLLFTSGIPASGSRRAENVPVATSTDFLTWTTVTDALPHLPRWAVTGFTWAPDVHRFGSGYVLYFSAALRHTDQQCIGVATGRSPTGPFAARATPFICQRALGGSIDPRVFTDENGSTWMLWKSDQNIGGSSTPTTMWSQRLSTNGLKLMGKPSALMSPDKAWQGTVVEAPDLIRVGNDYWLIYSGNWFNQPDYAVGAALCAGPSGPCADTSPAPLLASNAQGFGPGEASVFADADGIWLLYSPWFFPSAARGTPATSASLAADGSRLRPVEITRIGVGTTGPYLAAGGPPSLPSVLSARSGTSLIGAPQAP